MPVTVYDPKIQVLVKKNIGRSTVGGNVAASMRFEETPRQIDLTGYLGDMSSVVVQRSTRQSCGMFSINIADNFAPGELESIYGVVESMDVVEIRAAHDPSQYAGGQLPIIMRGFVTEVTRSEAMEGDGVNARPVRRVIISGQCYGKILVISVISYLVGMVLGQNVQTAWNLFLNYHVGSNVDQAASAFVTDVINKIINPFLAQMRTTAEANGVAQGVSPVMSLKIDASVTEGVVAPIGTNSWPGGTVDALLRHFGDVVPGFNEIYVEDRDDGPYLVYRPVPFQDISQKPIQPTSEPPAVIQITDDDLVSLNVTRSDAGVFSYYWVDNPMFQQTGGWALQANQASAGNLSTYLLTDYPNSSPYLYGMRLLKVETQQGSRTDGQAAPVMAKGQMDAVAWLANRRAVLMANNKDNVVYERGTMLLRGNEAIRAGMYINLTRGTGKFTASYYAHSVTHTFIPFRSFETLVTFDRGRGFIERVQRSGSPYLAEMNVNGVLQ